MSDENGPAQVLFREEFGIRTQIRMPCRYFFRFHLNRIFYRRGVRFFHGEIRYQVADNSHGKFPFPPLDMPTGALRDAPP
jgi:hypothetical protein